jgi:hypothetical protein
MGIKLMTRYRKMRLKIRKRLSRTPKRNRQTKMVRWMLS